ncbi:hypothetical protein [uncultured archaeal virus]|uniref:Uncharacterized protein n=1 Tax=uncultured archaeal virus TaxID=1960247 RepID=A0A8B0LNK2_9VIRU|nr:hypothetical protein [uncultured archaeal virus]
MATEEEFKGIVGGIGMKYQRAGDWKESDSIRGEIKNIDIKEMGENDEKKVVLKLQLEDTGGDEMNFVLNTTNIKIIWKELTKSGYKGYDFNKLVGKKVKISIIKVFFKSSYVNSFRVEFLN